MSTANRDEAAGPALLVVLLLAALVAGVLVYHARTPNLALEVVLPRERELGAGPNRASPIEFEFLVRFDDEHALAEIVGSGAVPVRTLAADEPIAAEEWITCAWDGRDDDGEFVAPGNYRLRVVLPGQDRDMVFPLRIAVEARANPGPAVDGSPCVTSSGETFG